MSYREEDGQVVLTMSREDYDLLLVILSLTEFIRFNGNELQGWRELCDRINFGNPNYTPYRVEGKKS
jgi:hypothetical protein